MRGKNTDKLGKATTLSQIGILSIKEGKRDEAFEYLQRARKEFEEVFKDLMLRFNVTPNENPYLKMVNDAIDLVFSETKTDLIFRDFLIP